MLLKLLAHVQLLSGRVTVYQTVKEAFCEGLIAKKLKLDELIINSTYDTDSIEDIAIHYAI